MDYHMLPCEEDFHERELMVELEKGSTSVHRFKCEFCPYTTNRKNHFTCHQRTHTGEKPFYCDDCERGFSQKASLTRHLILIHSYPSKHECEGCGKFFPSHSDLSIHHPRCELEPSWTIYETGTDTLVANEIATPLGVYTCGTCPFSTDYKGNLTVHLRTHSGERPHVCGHCEKGFADASTLKKHLRTHTGDKPYVCELCGRGFPLRSSLTTHTRSHTGDKPYECDVCGLRFGHRNTRAMHIKSVHDKIFDHECDMCEYRCSGKRKLLQHKIYHHNHPSKHQCEKCFKNFHAPSILVRHVMTCSGDKRHNRSRYSKTCY